MSDRVKLPALGESVSEATITRWLKHSGDAITEGEPLVEVSTDKVDTEVLSPFTGVVTEILVNEDETVDVGTVLAVISERSAEQPPDCALPSEPAEAAPASAPLVEIAVEPVAEPMVVAPLKTTTSSVSRPIVRHGYLTLLVRRAVKERGIDLPSLVGTGAGGRIRRNDLPPSTVLRAEGPGIAALMMAMEVDVTALKHSGPDAIPLLGRYSIAVADAVRAVPSVHRRIESGGPDSAGPPDSAIAVGAPEVDADYAFSAATSDGYHSHTPQIVSPRVSAVSFGAVRAVPRITTVEGGEAISIGRVLTATLSYDPRAVSSENALRFLATLRTSLTRRD